MPTYTRKHLIRALSDYTKELEREIEEIKLDFDFDKVKETLKKDSLDDLIVDHTCDICEYSSEIDGNNCYECVKGIRNNYSPKKEKNQRIKKYCRDCVHLHVEQAIIDKNGKVRGSGVCYNNAKACRCYPNTKLTCVFSRQGCANFEPRENDILKEDDK